VSFDISGVSGRKNSFWARHVDGQRLKDPIGSAFMVGMKKSIGGSFACGLGWLPWACAAACCMPPGPTGGRWLGRCTLTGLPDMRAWHAD
jgi:hypothetical protein